MCLNIITSIKFLLFNILNFALVVSRIKCNYMVYYITNEHKIQKKN